MLNYQSTSFHDALYARRLLGLKHAPSSPTGWRGYRLVDPHGALRLTDARHPLLSVLPQEPPYDRPDAWNPLRDLPMRGSPWGAAAPVCRPAKSSTLVWPMPRARDAIHQPFASQQLVALLAALGLDALTVHSAAPDRHTYLRRPDLGGGSLDESRADLAASGVRPADLLPVIGDGLSSWAVSARRCRWIRALLPYLQTLGIGLAPVVLAHQSRVALGDDIGETLRARKRWRS